mmetsp:Transcript_20337/g.62883  ORF Transcript_20337/g.62883 Transcript_20337/m.62883 type:complete len:183 (+) Transcript_20337:33-581(+)
MSFPRNTDDRFNYSSFAAAAAQQGGELGRLADVANPALAAHLAQSDVAEVKLCNSALLTAIKQGDLRTYEHLVDDALTCFEPEACGHLVEGKDFHKYYFRRHEKAAPPEEANVTTVDERVKVLGDVALVVYVRLIQSQGKTTATEETRVWQRAKDHATATSAISKWKLVHFHRSLPHGSSFG